MSNPAGVHIRPYEPRDREDVRRLCCETGFLGQPIDSVFEDRELFADYLTSYYTDVEPESSFVLERDGVVKGYLLGSRRPFRQQVFSIGQNLSLFVRAFARYASYNSATREFIGWVIRNSWKEVPAAPRRTAHFHFNVLPEAQSLAGAHGLFSAYLDYLRKAGERMVFGQIVTFESRRGAKFLERYGFRVVSRSEITKYRSVYPEPVFLCTVVKDLQAASPRLVDRPLLQRADSGWKSAA